MEIRTLVTALFSLLVLLRPLHAFSFGFLGEESSTEASVVFVNSDDSDKYTWYNARDLGCDYGWGQYLFFLHSRNIIVRDDRASPSPSNDYRWTGLNRLNNATEWQWSDGSPDTAEIGSELGFAGGQNKKCVAMRIKAHAPSLFERFEWKAFNCGSRLRYYWRLRSFRDRVTRRPPPLKVDSNCPDGWRDAGTDRCFKDFNHPSGLDWETAEKTCLSLPYYEPNLACANTQGEITSLTRLVTYPSQERFWFGLFRESVSGPWMWADNTEFTVTNFHRYLQPNYDYGGGLIDNRAIPRGSWDVALDRDGLRAVTTRYICQVMKDPNYNHTSPYDLKIFKDFKPSDEQLGV